MLQHLGLLHPGGHGLSHLLQEDHGKVFSLVLFVQPHGLLHGFPVTVDVGGKTKGCQQRREGLDAIVIIYNAQVKTQPESGHHSRRDRLTMGPGFIISRQFVGVADGVAEVQDHPATGVPLVLFHNKAFYIAAGIQNVFNICHDFGPGGVGTEKIEEVLIGNTAVLDDLRHTVGKGFVIQGVQRFRVHQDCLGLPEGAHQILSVCKVDSHLASHRGIYLGQKGGGDLDKVHSPEKGGGGKTRQVAYHSASQSYHSVSAGEAIVHDSLPQGGKVGGAFGPFSGGARKQARIETGGLQAVLHSGTVEGFYVGVGNDGDSPGPGTDPPDLLPHPVQ